MAIVGKALADGKLAAAEAVIYTAPGGTTTYIKTMTFANTGAGQNVVILKVRKDGANSRRLIRVPLETNEALYFDEVQTLEAADEVRGEATNANEVDYTINGAEEA